MLRDIVVMLHHIRILLQLFNLNVYFRRAEAVELLKIKYEIFVNDVLMATTVLHHFLVVALALVGCFGAKQL